MLDSDRWLGSSGEELRYAPSGYAKHGGDVGDGQACCTHVRDHLAAGRGGAALEVGRLTGHLADVPCLRAQVANVQSDINVILGGTAVSHRLDEIAYLSLGVL